jgi:hypothetical protein
VARSKRRTRGYIEELPSGSFRAVVYAGRDPPNNKRRYLRETANDYLAAQVALTRLQNQIDEERHPKTNITVGQAIDQWLDVADLSETTRDRYLDLIRIYIRPTLGELPAAKLDAELLERFYARLQRCRSCAMAAAGGGIPAARWDMICILRKEGSGIKPGTVHANRVVIPADRQVGAGCSCSSL